MCCLLNTTIMAFIRLNSYCKIIFLGVIRRKITYVHLFIFVSFVGIILRNFAGEGRDGTFRVRIQNLQFPILGSM